MGAGTRSVTFAPRPAWRSAPASWSTASTRPTCSIVASANLRTASLSRRRTLADRNADTVYGAEIGLLGDELGELGVARGVVANADQPEELADPPSGTLATLHRAAVTMLMVRAARCPAAACRATSSSPIPMGRQGRCRRRRQRVPHRPGEHRAGERPRCSSRRRSWRAAHNHPPGHLPMPRRWVSACSRRRRPRRRRRGDDPQATPSSGRGADDTRSWPSPRPPRRRSTTAGSAVGHHGRDGYVQLADVADGARPPRRGPPAPSRAGRSSWLATSGGASAPWPAT